MIALLLLACSTAPSPDATNDIDASQAKIDPGPAAPWVPPHCYATSTAEAPRNPCYTCHQRGRKPHTLDDSELQAVYDFQGPVQENPWTNLFEDRSAAVAAISDPDIDAWVRASNAPAPDAAWGAHFDVDEAGYDRTKDGTPTGWRAYGYSPFPGMFPTNGAWGDAFIRLPEALRPDLDTYAVNLAILDAILLRQDVAIPPTDEAKLGVDLDLDGTLGTATRVTYRFAKDDKPMKWAGASEQPPTPGLYPQGTEFLHTVRYLDPTSPVRMAERMKEVRYQVKDRWITYADLASGVVGEESERAAFPDRIEPIIGDPENGVTNGAGWRFRAFIEDEKGTLRSQTKAELDYCIGCHGGIGVSVDSTLSYVRKTGWGHSHEMGALPDPIRADGEGAYATYLRNAKAGDSFGGNPEPIAKFFGEDAEFTFSVLARDIRVLALPSANRARDLNKAYKVLVEEQSYVRGRDPVWGLDDEALKQVKPLQPTGVASIVTPAWMKPRE